MERIRDVILPSDEAIERQSAYDPAGKVYTARCGICGKAKSQRKPLFGSRSTVMKKLSLDFSFCDICGKWVCEDCFLIDDGNGNSMGICTACAGERGVTGLTSGQFEKAWPRIESSYRARVNAVKRVEENR